MSNTTIRIADVMQKHCFNIYKKICLIIPTESILISVVFDHFFVTEFPGSGDPLCVYEPLKGRLKSNIKEITIVSEIKFHLISLKRCASLFSPHLCFSEG